jgi:phage tail tape-measure protein
VRAARHFAGRVVRNALPDTVEVVGLVVCELARSWIRHTGGGFELAIIRDGREIRVEATDQAGGIPAMCSPKPTDPSGRAAQDRRYAGGGGWGVRTGVAAGKTVWFTVPVTALAGAGC